MRSTAWANGPQVIDVGKQAVELYSALGDADAVGRLSDLVGWRMLWWDRGEESAELVRAALDILPDVPSARRARLPSTLGLGLRLQVDKGGLGSIQRGPEGAEGAGEGVVPLVRRYGRVGVFCGRHVRVEELYAIAGHFVELARELIAAEQKIADNELDFRERLQAEGHIVKLSAPRKP